MIHASTGRMSFANALESSIVIERCGGSAAAIEPDAFIDSSGIELMPISIDQSKAARRARQRYGKGKDPAQLNFGDCFAYALAEVMGSSTRSTSEQCG